MKRFALAGLVLVMSMSFVPLAWSEEGDVIPNDSPAAVVAEVQAPAKPAEPPSPAEIAKQKERQKKIEQQRAALEATQWSVSLVSNDPKVKPESDVFTFINGQFKSENRSARGFSPTNYTVTVSDEEKPTATFETMQSGKEGRVFVKGIWKDGVMEGRITEQSEDLKKSVDYFFSNAQMKKMDKETQKSEMDKIKPKADEAVGEVLVSPEAPVDTPKAKSKSRTH